jgi:hypothetical protein
MANSSSMNLKCNNRRVDPSVISPASILREEVYNLYLQEDTMVFLTNDYLETEREPSGLLFEAVFLTGSGLI